MNHAIWLVLPATAISVAAALTWFRRSILAKTAGMLHDITLRTETAHTETASMLRTIHTLVNSNLTTAQQDQLDSMRAMLRSDREIITIKQERGLPITAADFENIEQVEMRIAELARNLVHKKVQTDLADAQAERDS
jgi:hypothetical protein